MCCSASSQCDNCGRQGAQIRATIFTIFSLFYIGSSFWFLSKSKVMNRRPRAYVRPRAAARPHRAAGPRRAARPRRATSPLWGFASPPRAASPPANSNVEVEATDGDRELEAFCRRNPKRFTRTPNPHVPYYETLIEELQKKKAMNKEQPVTVEPVDSPFESSEESDATSVEELERQCRALIEEKARLPPRLSIESPYPKLLLYEPPPDFEPVDALEDYEAMSPEERAARVEPLFQAYFRHPEPRPVFVKQQLLGRFLVRRPEQESSDSDSESSERSPVPSASKVLGPHRTSTPKAAMPRRSTGPEINVAPPPIEFMDQEPRSSSESEDSQRGAPQAARRGAPLAARRGAPQAARRGAPLAAAARYRRRGKSNFHELRDHLRFTLEIEKDIRRGVPEETINRRMGEKWFGDPEYLMPPQDFPEFPAITSWVPPPPCSPLRVKKAKTQQELAAKEHRRKVREYQKSTKPFRERVQKAILDAIYGPIKSPGIGPTATTEDQPSTDITAQRLSLFSELQGSHRHSTLTSSTVSRPPDDDGSAVSE